MSAYLPAHLTPEEADVVDKMRAEASIKKAAEAARKVPRFDAPVTVPPFDDMTDVAQTPRPPLTEADALADVVGAPRPSRFRRPSEVLGLGTPDNAHEEARSATGAALALLDMGPGRCPVWKVKARLVAAYEALGALE